MIKIDLITGFLGAGKTTFIKTYAKYLITQGLNIAILENDYGAINIDMMLLEDSFKDTCELEMITGGSDFETHQRRFKTKLISMGMRGYDRVIVEPSGLFEVDEFFDLLYEEPLNNWYEVGNVFTIVDSQLEDLSRESDYYLVSQLSQAGLVVLSKIQDTKEDVLNHTVEHINNAMKEFKCEKQLKYFKKDWYHLEDSDYEELLHAGYQISDYQKMFFNKEDVYRSIFFMDTHMTLESIKEKVDNIFNDPQCGHIFRIKGFINEHSWYELNVTKNDFSLEPINNGQDVIIVIGEKLNEEYIKRLLLN